MVKWPNVFKIFMWQKTFQNKIMQHKKSMKICSSQTKWKSAAVKLSDILQQTLIVL